MKISEAFPSKYLKSQELEGDVTYTISHVEIETVGRGDDSDQKPVVYFNETDRGLALNKTNANTISGLYGDDTDGWIGKTITLFATEVDFQGKQTLAIRVRMRKPAAAQQPTGNGAGNPKGQNDTGAEARKAWEGFTANMKGEFPNVSADDLTKAWRSALMRYFPGRKLPEGVTAAEWRQFIADGFAPKPKESPISKEPVFAEADVPF
jgi:hypothetical protein